jgi:hypothetical protein
MRYLDLLLALTFDVPLIPVAALLILVWSL